MFKKIDSNFLGKFVKVFVLIAVLVGGFGVKDGFALQCNNNVCVGDLSCPDSSYATLNRAYCSDGCDIYSTSFCAGCVSSYSYVLISGVCRKVDSCDGTYTSAACSYCGATGTAGSCSGGSGDCDPGGYGQVPRDVEDCCGDPAM